MTSKLIKKYHSKDLNIAFNDGMNHVKEEIINIIDFDRDKGNIENYLDDKNKFFKNGFSPALCLSKIIKYCKQ